MDNYKRLVLVKMLSDMETKWLGLNGIRNEINVD